MRNTRAILEKHGVHLTKSLGQNFLIDDSVVEEIVEAAGITDKDVVIEIGPGAGSMTRKLAKAAAFVVAIEIDKKLIPVLDDTLAEYNNVKIINEDAMRVNFDELLKNIIPERFADYKIKVCANLPYYITTPLIMMLLEQSKVVSSMTFMVQKEVADRMCAAPGKKDYGALTLAVNYHSVPCKKFEVPPHCFFPQPKVYSTIITLERHEVCPIEVLDEDYFFKVIKASFAQRRKTLLNGLANAPYVGKSKPQIMAAFAKCGIPEGVRGETLTLEQFGEVSNALMGICD